MGACSSFLTSWTSFFRSPYAENISASADAERSGARVRRTVFTEFEEIEIAARLQAVRERIQERVEEAAEASRKSLEDRAEAEQVKKQRQALSGSKHGAGWVEWREARA